MISWKFAGTAAAGAFLLSFIVGVISGVGFAAIILRALLFGALFALLAVGSELMIRPLLPELFSVPAGGGDHDAEHAPQTGGSVDITLDDDGGEADGAAGSSRTAGDRSEGFSDGFVEEIGGTQPVAAAEFAPETVGAGDEPEEVETLESMDELPSLDSFSDSFESNWGSDTESGSQSSEREVDVDILGEAQSAGEVARAVKTMMKRDQEG